MIYTHVAVKITESAITVIQIVQATIESLCSIAPDKMAFQTDNSLIPPRKHMSQCM